jgi:hypothetical protein
MSRKSKRITREDLVQGKTIYITSSYLSRIKRDAHIAKNGFTPGWYRVYQTSNSKVEAYIVARAPFSSSDEVMLTKSGSPISSKYPIGLYSVRNLLDTAFTCRRAAQRAHAEAMRDYPHIPFDGKVQPMYSGKIPTPWPSLPKLLKINKDAQTNHQDPHPQD